MDEILKFLEEAKYFFFATCEDGQPRVRPFAFFMEYEGMLYLGMGDYKLCFRQIKANPKFELCAYSEAKGVWLRLSGTAVCDERPEVNEAAFAKVQFLRDKYTKPDGPRHAAFRVMDGIAVFQDFSENTWSVTF